MGVPLGTATAPSIILALDYRGLNSAPDLATYSTVHTSHYTGHFVAIARSRKWAPWHIAANCATLAERPNGTAQVFFGKCGWQRQRIYELSATQYSDDGAAIPSYYTTYFVPSLDEEQSLGVAAHRKLFAYLSLFTCRGREFEPHRVPRQRGVSAGAAVAAAQLAGVEGFGAADQHSGGALRLPVRDEPGWRLVQPVAPGALGEGGSVIARAGRQLTSQSGWSSKGT